MIYHYQPREATALQSKLSVTTSNNLSSNHPTDVTVDSRYDLKRWRIEPTSESYRARQGWIRIRTNDKWDLDLSVNVKSSVAPGLFKSVVAGVLIAIPPIFSVVTQKDTTLHTQLSVALISLVSGIMAAAAVVFGFDTFS
jgi:hypothetical protein